MAERTRPPEAEEDTWECAEPECTRWTGDPTGQGWLVIRRYRGKRSTEAVYCPRHKHEHATEGTTLAIEITKEKANV